MRRKQKEIITTLDLSDIIRNKKAIPTPNYEKEKEYRFIVQDNSIFAKAIKRIKPIKF